MDLTPVISSNIESIGHNNETRTLRVLFKNGRAYDYANVPGLMFAAMLAADSAGKFLNECIKPHYAFKQVEADG